jgi:DNA-binding response OmpR family regulator
MKKVNILIVDDEALIREGLRSLLEKEVFVAGIFEAGDAIQFHEQIALGRIDVILLDIRLRDTMGVELLIRSRSWSRDRKSSLLRVWKESS